MRARTITDPDRFALEAGPLLAENEARHNLILGICSNLRDHPEVFDRFHLWVVDGKDGPVAAAVLTPPHNLVVARPRVEGAIEALADAVHEEGIRLPGVGGALPEARRFAARWQELTGARVRTRMAQRIFRLTAVRPVRSASGAMRWATPSDRDLVIGWYGDFSTESLPEEQRDAASASRERFIDLRLRREGGGIAMWEDGGPVSLAGYGSRTPNGMRIGPVYTPPEYRRRGYATALVAGLSRALLEDGMRFCFLFTDTANPTSNRIYMDIGYRPVCDAVDLGFDYAVTPEGTRLRYLAGRSPTGRGRPGSPSRAARSLRPRSSPSAWSSKVTRISSSGRRFSTRAMCS
jgi:predicted GNAT family acetyltransferase